MGDDEYEKVARRVQQLSRPDVQQRVMAKATQGLTDHPEIKTAMEEMGHYYPVTSLSPTLLRFVRRKELRRIKDKKVWLYTR